MIAVPRPEPTMSDKWPEELQEKVADCWAWHSPAIDTSVSGTPSPTITTTSGRSGALSASLNKPPCYANVFLTAPQDRPFQQVP